MTNRLPELQKAIDLLNSGFKAVVPQQHPAAKMLAQAFKLLENAAPPLAATPPNQQPAVRFMNNAIELGRQGPAHSAQFCRHLPVLEPLLHWIQAKHFRPNQGLENGYAQSELVGPSGIEVRHDVKIGISILDNNTVYPEHRHPPEEVYLALTGGQWSQNSGEWVDYRAGEFVYNATNTKHSMAAKSYPQLSVWILLLLNS